MSSGTDDANLSFPVTRYPGNLGMEESIVADNRCFRNIGFKGQEAFFRYREPLPIKNVVLALVISNSGSDLC
jgi:hypothetical protein